MIYIDSSFLVSLYCLDANSLLAEKTLQATQDDRLINWICQVETVNAFQLRVFRGEMNARQAEIALHQFEIDLSSGVYQLTSLTEAACRRANRLSLKLTAAAGLRAADMLHISAAQDAGATEFFSFDLRQRSVAQTVGLKLNPLPQS